MSETHDFSTYPDDGGLWLAECSCGWSGELWEDADDAQLDWEDHCDDVFCKATMGQESREDR